MGNAGHLKYSDVVQLNRKLVLIYNWIYIFSYISRIVIQKYVLGGDNAGRGIFVMSILALLINLPKIVKFFFNNARPACQLWLWLTAFSFVNSMIMGYTWKDGFIFYVRENFTEPLVFLMVATCMLREHQTKTLTVMLSSLLFFIAIGIFKTDFSTSYRGRYLNDDIGNFLPLFAVPTILVASMLRQKEVIKKSFIPIVILAFVLILLCATRKSFAAILIILAAYMLGRINMKKASHVTLLITMIVVTYVGLTFVMENTVLGERFSGSFKEQEEVFPLVSDPVANKVLNGLVGDRAVMYYYGTKVFLEHPVNGVGLLNYSKVTGERIRIHSEYIVQLCENGIIGFALLVAFIAVVLHQLMNAEMRQETHKIVIGGFLAMLVIDFTAWTYCSDYAMVVYAVVLATLYPKTKTVDITAEEKEDEENSNSEQ